MSSRDSPPTPEPRVASSHLHPRQPTISLKSQLSVSVLNLKKDDVERVISIVGSDFDDSESARESQLNE